MGKAGNKKKDFVWEILNSLWILLAVVPMFNWLAFFWVGARAKKKKWIILGCFYLFTSWGVLMLSAYIFAKVKILYTLGGLVFMFSWIASIVHTLFIRNEYIAYLRGDEKITKHKPIISEKSLELSGKPVNNTVREQTPTKQAANLKIDINSCSLEELLVLPGIGIVQAKKAINLREENNGFSSVGEFCEKLELQPHFVSQIEKIVYVGKLENQDVADENPGRIIDF